MPMSDNGAIIVVYRNCPLTLVENRQSTFCSYLCEGYLGTILCLSCVIVPSNYTLNVSNFHIDSSTNIKVMQKFAHSNWQLHISVMFGQQTSDLNCVFSMSSFVMLICYGLHFGHA